MRRFVSPSLAVTMLFVAGAVGAVVSGAPTPAFAIADTSGKCVQLGDYKGKYVVLEWTNHDKRSAYPPDAKTAINYIRAALAKAMSGKPVTVGNTTPYGCSVNY